MKFELNDKAMAEFRHKLERSVIAKYLVPYVWELEKRNYKAFDGLVMLMIEFGDTAFIYGLRAVLAVDPSAPEKPDYYHEAD